MAFHQASFGVPYAKPTRLLLCTSLDMPDFVYEGLPSYDDHYKGPLPSAQGFGKMFQRQAKGAFKTTGSEQWPVAMCQWLSAMLLSSCSPLKTPLERGAPLRPTISYRTPSPRAPACWVGRALPVSAESRRGGGMLAWQVAPPR